MKPQTFAEFPPRPESEVEWEDLLVRLELMPRALSAVTESLDLQRSQATRVLRQLVDAELAARSVLERAAGIDPHSAAISDSPVLDSHSLEHFVRLRARNFAIVQRRGLEVWDWEVGMEGGAAVTVHQVLQSLVRGDVAALAEIRRLSAAGTEVC